MLKPRLLIVEDSVEIGEMLEVFFTRHNYEIVIAHDGQTAIEICLAKLPSLVLLDVGLPDIDGFNVCRQLRQTARARHLPVIFATKMDRKAERIEGLSLGADDFIAKPFDLEELLLRVKNAINRSARYSLMDPRTGLPGAEIVRQELARAAGMPQRRVLNFRVANLEPFRDLYGSLAATDVLRATALLLNQLLTERGQADDFLGQVSDDTFVVICSAADAAAFTQQATAQFAEQAPHHYSFGRRDGAAVHATASGGGPHALPMLALVAETFNQ